MNECKRCEQARGVAFTYPMGFHANADPAYQQRLLDTPDAGVCSGAVTVEMSAVAALRSDSQGGKRCCDSVDLTVEGSTVIRNWLHEGCSNCK